MPHAPHLPGFFTAAASVLPVKPLAFLLSRLAASVADGRPGLADRLGTYAGKTIAVTPADLDLVFLVTFQSGKPAVEVVRTHEFWRSDARVSGPLLALIDLVEGRTDADALFFSREITIEGDMEAVLALRNALDAEGLDLMAEAFRPLGPLAGGMSRAGRNALQLFRDRLKAHPQEPSA